MRHFAGERGETLGETCLEGEMSGVSDFAGQCFARALLNNVGMDTVNSRAVDESSGF